MPNEITQTDGSGAGGHRTIKERAIREFIRFWTLALYLWLLFGLFVLNQTIIYRQEGLDLAFHGFALLNALVLGKVMLVFEDLELARWLRGRPLILTILFEAGLCTALFVVFHIVERVLVAAFRGEPITASMPSFGGGGLFGLVIVALIIFVSLLPFFAFKNVARAIGVKRMKEILFHRSAANDEKI
ncbi:MAG: hypothetical protein U1E67_19195 [Hyphomicrobiales bacterium]